MVEGIGIDLGTRTSAIAVAAGGTVEVLPDRQGERLLPSVVYLGRGQAVHTGDEARPYAAIEPTRTVDDFMPLLGRPFAGEAAVAAHTRLTWAPGPTPSGVVGVDIDGRVHPLTGCAALLCATLRQRLPPAGVGAPAALVVPARSTAAQRRVWRTAAHRAGFAAPRLVSTPLAVARAWAERRAAIGQRSPARALVVDAGASGVELAVVRVEPRLIEVQAVVGEARLGGQDVDLALADLIAERFTARTGLECRPDLAGYAVVRSHAEWARAVLSSSPAVEVRIPAVAALPAGPVDLVERVERADLEALLATPIEQMLAWADLVTARAGVAPAALDAVLLVGGVASTPAVQAAFGAWAQQAADLTQADAQSAAVRGAALLATDATKSRRWTLIDGCALGLRIGRDPDDTVEIVPPDCPVPLSVGPIVPPGPGPLRLYQGEGGELDGLVGEVLVTGDQPMRLHVDIDRDGIVSAEVEPTIDPGLLEPLDLSLDGSMVDISAMLATASVSGVMQAGRRRAHPTSGPHRAMRPIAATTGPLPMPRVRVDTGPMPPGRRTRPTSGPLPQPRTRSGSMRLRVDSKPRGDSKKKTPDG